MLTELKEQLYVVYTPACDPDANRIEWLWRISRRLVAHNHQRNDLDLLLARFDPAWIGAYQAIVKHMSVESHSQIA